MSFWHLITPLGEGLVLAPAVCLLAAWLAPGGKGGAMLAWRWLAAVAAAALVTAITKVAFMGWGLGSAQWNFTGVSGHTMFAAAVYPLLLRTIASAAPPSVQWGAVASGSLLAALIGVSRVQIGAHSWSEVIAGFAVGSLATLCVLGIASAPARRPPRWLLVGVALWLGLMAIGAPRSPAHGWITEVALSLSGRHKPYTRAELLRGRIRPLSMSPPGRRHDA